MNFKPAIKQYKDYLVEQLMTAGVEVRLGTEAVPEILAGEDYDAVIAGLWLPAQISGSSRGGGKDCLCAHGCVRT